MVNKHILAVFAIALLGVSGVGQSPSWTQNPTNGRWYSVGNLNTSWHSGEAQAVAQGGHLATIRNSAEQAWIEATFASELGIYGLWIGFNDIAIEGQWVWSSGEPTTFINWSPGQPDNGSATAENAAHLIGSLGGAAQWMWNDETESFNNILRPLIEASSPPPVATVAVYGAGCGTPSLGLTPTTNPIIGTNAGAVISNAPTSFGGVMFGVSNTLVNGAAILPYNLASAGMPGCYLLQSTDIFGLSATPIFPSLLRFNAAIPYNPALLTQQFYIQAYAFAPGANASQVVTSNGIAWTIGNQ